MYIIDTVVCIYDILIMCIHSTVHIYVCIRPYRVLYSTHSGMAELPSLTVYIYVHKNE
jgi:hypothetical protein